MLQLYYLQGEDKMKNFLTSEKTVYRLLRTICQGVIGVVCANLDLIIGFIPMIPEELRPIIVLIVMAILSPLMSELGKSGSNE